MMSAKFWLKIKRLSVRRIITSYSQRERERERERENDYAKENSMPFLCPQRNFGRHIVIALSVRPSVRQSVRPSVRPSRFCVRSISPIFFEVGIPNLVCGYILGWRSVAYHFRVTVTLTLTSDLVFRIIVSGAYLLYYLR